MPFSIAKAWISFAVNLKPLDSGLKKARGKVDKSTRAAGKRAGRNISLGMASVATAVVAGLFQMAAAAEEFDKEFSKVATLQVENLDKLKSGVLEVAREFGVNAPEQIQNLYDVLSAGIPEDSAIFVLKEAARGAKGGVGELSDAVDLGTSLINAYGLEASDMTRIMGQAITAIDIGKTSMGDIGSAVGKAAALMASAKIPTEQFLAAIAALTTTGAPAAEQVSALRAAIANIIKPSAEAAKVAEALGLAFDAEALAAQGLPGFLDSVSEATGGSITEMGKLFGSIEGLNAVLSLTGAQRDTFVNALDSMDNATDNLTAAFDAAVAADPSFELDKLKESGRALAILLGGELVTSLDDTAKILNPIVDDIVRWVENNPDLIRGLVGFGSGVKGISVVVNLLITALKDIPGAAGKAGSSLKGLFEFVNTAALKMFNFINNIAKAFQGWADPITNAVSLLTGLLNLIGNFRTGNLLAGTRSQLLVDAGIVPPPSGFLDQGPSFASEVTGGSLARSSAPSAAGPSIQIGKIEISVSMAPGESPEDTGRRAAESLIDTLRFGLERPGALAAMAGG